MKKIRLIPTIFAVLLLLQLATPLFSNEVAADNVGKEYYFSSVHGDNSNDGKNEDAAWETLDKLKGVELSAGDKVYLESGSVFNGYIHLSEVNGTENDPIIITSYGKGDKPTINGNGEGIWYQGNDITKGHDNKEDNAYVSSTILLYDSSYIEISNLKITNESDDWDYMYSEKERSTDRMARTGVSAIAQNKGTMEHIYLNSLNIENIDGNINFKHMNNGGIHFSVSKPENETDSEIARYHDIQITNNTINNVKRSGISFGDTYQKEQFNGREISDETIAKYGHSDIVIKGNYVKKSAGDGIVVMYADRPVVSSNVADTSGYALDKGLEKSFTSDSVGIRPWKTKNALFEHNEVLNTVGENNGEGQAWNIDYSDGTIYQYNYSHDNGGGAVLVSLEEAVNSIFRYNISQNDIGQLINLQNNPMVNIHNNIFYLDGNQSTRVLDNDNGQAYIANNIFYNTSSEKLDKEWKTNKNQTFTNNLYYGYDSVPTGDDNPIEKDPMFVNLTSNIDFDRFKVDEKSPVVDAGIYIPNNAEKDFFGNPIGSIPDIGIHEINANDAENLEEVYSEIYSQTSKKFYNIPKQTTVEGFLENIEVIGKAELTVQDSDGEKLTKNVVIENGYKLIAVFESENTKQYNLELVVEPPVYAEYTTDGITASAGSHQNGEGPNNVLDGNNGTLWHTSWNGTERENVWISLDLGEVKPVAMLKYVPRQSQENGIITKYTISVKEEANADWIKVNSGTWDKNNETEHAYFESINARYIKLQADESASDSNKIYGSAAEIRIGHEEEAQ